MKGINDMIQLANINYESSKSIIQNQFKIEENYLNEIALSSSVTSLKKEKYQRSPKKGK